MPLYFVKQYFAYTFAYTFIHQYWPSASSLLLLIATSSSSYNRRQQQMKLFIAYTKTSNETYKASLSRDPGQTALWSSVE